MQSIVYHRCKASYIIKAQAIMHAGAWWDTVPKGLMIYRSFGTEWYAKPTGDPQSSTSSLRGTPTAAWIQKRTFENKSSFFGAGDVTRTHDLMGYCPFRGNLRIMPQGRWEKEKPHFCGAWSWWCDSNTRPADYESAALPTVLHQRIGFWQRIYYTRFFPFCQYYFSKKEEHFFFFACHSWFWHECMVE